MSILSIVARLSVISCVSLALAKIDKHDIYHQQGCELDIGLYTPIPSNETTYAWLPYQYNETEILNIVSDVEIIGGELIGYGGFQHWKINFAKGVRETTISFIYMPQHLFPPQDASVYNQTLYHIHISDSTSLASVANSFGNQ